MRDDSVYLEYIEESIDLIYEYLGGATSLEEETLFRDLLRQDAVLRRMETLGEATTHLSDELKARHPDIDWREIANFRNRLAHGYADLRLDLVWASIVNDLPALKALIAQEKETS